MRRVEQLTAGAIGVGTRFRAEMVSMGRPGLKRLLEEGKTAEVSA